MAIFIGFMAYAILLVSFGFWSWHLEQHYKDEFGIPLRYPRLAVIVSGIFTALLFPLLMLAIIIAKLVEGLFDIKEGSGQ